MKINKKMLKNKGVFAFLFALSVIASSCAKAPYEELTDSKEGAMLFIEKANNGVLGLDLTDGATERTLDFRVGFGALGLPASDIGVALKDDTNAVIDSLNEIQTSLGLGLYKPFPEDAYKIGLLNVTIPKGNTLSNLTTITYYPDKFDKSSNYLLAISIADASGYAISPRLKTLLIAATPQ